MASKTLILLSSILLLFITPVYAQKEIPHPPTYSDYIKAMDDDPFASEYQEAAIFTEGEIDSIVEEGNSMHILGAGIQMAISKSENEHTLLILAVERTDGNPAAIFSLILYYLGQSMEEGSALDPDFADQVSRLRAQDSNNSLSYYLNAIEESRKSNHAKALEEIINGNKAPYFDAYTKERFLSVRKAAESLGYPKFTARNLSMSSSMTILAFYSLLNRTCAALYALEDDRLNEIVFNLGDRLERESTLLIGKLLSKALQSKSTAHRQMDDFVNRKEATKLNEDAYRNHWEDFKKIQPLLTEEDWVRFYDVFLETDEIEATKKMKEIVSSRNKE